MLTKLRLKNFKAWKDTGAIRLAPLTGNLLRCRRRIPTSHLSRRRRIQNGSAGLPRFSDTASMWSFFALPTFSAFARISWTHE